MSTTFTVPGYPALGEGRERGGPTREDGAPRKREAGGLRYRLLSGRPRPDVGPGRRPQFHQADRVLPRGLPCARRLAPRQDRRGQAAGRGEEGDGVHAISDPYRSDKKVRLGLSKG